MTWENDMRDLLEDLHPRTSIRTRKKLAHKQRTGAFDLDIPHKLIPVTKDTKGSKFHLSLATTGLCITCGRPWVSAVTTNMNLKQFEQKFQCYKCHPYSTEERIDHEEWVRNRRGTTGVI